MNVRHTSMSVLTTPTLPVLQRSRGIVRLAFKLRDNSTVLKELYQHGGYFAKLPASENGHPTEAVLINTSGGVTDGDTLETDVRWCPGTLATVTTQAAERVYKSRYGPSKFTTKLFVDKDSTAFWLPQEMILFDGGRYTRSTEIKISGNGKLLALESLVLGRTAMGEYIHNGFVMDSWRVHLDNRLIFADNFGLDDDVADLQEILLRSAVSGGAGALATLVYIGNDAEQQLKFIRYLLNECDLCSGATNFGQITLVRLLADDGQSLRAALIKLIESMQQRIFCSDENNGSLLPRVWFC